MCLVGSVTLYHCTPAEQTPQSTAIASHHEHIRVHYLVRKPYHLIMDQLHRVVKTVNELLQYSYILSPSRPLPPPSPLLVEILSSLCGGYVCYIQTLAKAKQSSQPTTPISYQIPRVIIFYQLAIYFNANKKYNVLTLLSIYPQQSPLCSKTLPSKAIHDNQTRIYASQLTSFYCMVDLPNVASNTRKIVKQM